LTGVFQPVSPRAGIASPAFGVYVLLISFP
jgi:hypothetical protein